MKLSSSGEDIFVQTSEILNNAIFQVLVTRKLNKQNTIHKKS